MFTFFLHMFTSHSRLRLHKVQREQAQGNAGGGRVYIVPSTGGPFGQVDGDGAACLAGEFHADEAA